MPDIKRILCATDFSAAAKRAYEYAIFLALKTNAEILVVHAYQLPALMMSEGMMEMPMELKTNLQNRLLEQLDAFVKAADTKGVTVNSRLCEAEPYVEIARTARDIGASLVIVGTHGRTGLSHLLIGSVAERVVRTCEVPVLVVR